MATLETVTKLLAMLSIVLQDKKTSEPFYALYYEDLRDLPDEVLIKAAVQCRRTCRFFPTIAELIKAAEPILQEWNLENRRLLENDIHSKCPENVYRDDKNNPRCRIEDDNFAGCELAGDGRCGKWIDGMFDGK